MYEKTQILIWLVFDVDFGGISSKIKFNLIVIDNLFYQKYKDDVCIVK